MKKKRRAAAKPTELAIERVCPGQPEERVHQVFVWILDGNSQHDIAESIAKEWPEQQSTPLIVAAMERIMKSGEADPSTIKGWCIEATRQLYQRAVMVGDLATSLRAIKQLHDFAG